jgi:hypothetical protein
MLVIRNAVGRGCLNTKADVKAIQERLNAIAKGPLAENGVCDSQTLDAICAFQDHFMLTPDGVISPEGPSMKFLRSWKSKPSSHGVNLLLGKLQRGWDLVNPLLPEGSYCSSGYRSADEQRRILHKFFQVKYKDDIIEGYGQKRYDEVSKDLRKNEASVLEMVRGVGQDIAAPGASMHQKGRAIDVGGPNHLDKEQVRIIKVVARANPNILTGKVLKERNGCVHFEVHP